MFPEHQLQRSVVQTTHTNHAVSRTQTQAVSRNNLTQFHIQFTRKNKTVSFSKSIQLAQKGETTQSHTQLSDTHIHSNQLKNEPLACQTINPLDSKPSYHLTLASATTANISKEEIHNSKTPYQSAYHMANTLISRSTSLSVIQRKTTSISRFLFPLFSLLILKSVMLFVSLYLRHINYVDIPIVHTLTQQKEAINIGHWWYIW